MAEIANSKIKKIKRGFRIAIVAGFFAFIVGAVLVYLHQKEMLHGNIVLYIGIPVSIFGIIAILLGAGLLIVYNIKLGNKSGSVAYTMSKELDDPETVYIKECTTYLTPNYMLTLSTNPRIVKYSEMVWVYILPAELQTMAKETCLLVRKQDGKTVMMAETSPCERNNIILRDIMNTIKERNPNVEIGYSKERKEKYGRTRFW